MRAPARRTHFAALGVAALLLACSAPILGPPTGPHRPGAGNDAIIVHAAPPPVQPECVPPQPREECVWVDGSWSWAGRRWEWLSGAWVVPPRGCYHAKAFSQWLDAGIQQGGQTSDRLFYFPAAWYPERVGDKCNVPKLCLQATPIEEC